jgi:hypothetical protein
MTQLSEHFTAEEATNSSTATRMGIDNTPSDEQLANMKQQAEGMELVRRCLGHPVNVDSWLRVEALEKVLTQKDFIQWCHRHSHDETDPASWTLYFSHKAHPKGFGTDFICQQFGTPEQIVSAIVSADIKFDQLIMEGAWVHISFDPQMRNMIMKATFKDGTPTYTQGE